MKNIIDAINGIMKTNNLIPINEYFNVDHIPESFSGKGFLIVPIATEGIDSINELAKPLTISDGIEIRILYSKKVDHFQEQMIDIFKSRDSIIKGIFDLDNVVNKFNWIRFQGSRFDPVKDHFLLTMEFQFEKIIK